MAGIEESASFSSSSLSIQGTLDRLPPTERDIAIRKHESGVSYERLSKKEKRFVQEYLRFNQQMQNALNKSIRVDTTYSIEAAA